MGSSSQHLDEIRKNQESWQRKPLLRRIYRGFHREIAAELSDLPGATVEIGSGVANIRDTIPGCLCTDLFPNPWLDQVENAYRLTFQDGSLANVILFDVFHHLRYPGTALQELHRVLVRGGRLIIFEPRISLLGALVFGLLHHEPIGALKPIEWSAPSSFRPEALDDYYAAQGNATRVFLRRSPVQLPGWRVVRTLQRSALAYVASGGYSKPQLYPDSWYPLMRSLEKVLDRFPALFATRMLVVLERA
jgi:SAM-dependent methyltransferase